MQLTKQQRLRLQTLEGLRKSQQESQKILDELMNEDSSSILSFLDFSSFLFCNESSH